MDNNGILESAVRSATEKLAEKGVEGVDTKEVILATFGSIGLGGGIATSKQLTSLLSKATRFGWTIVGMCFSTLLAIVLVLIFL